MGTGVIFNPTTRRVRGQPNQRAIPALDDDDDNDATISVAQITPGQPTQLLPSVASYLLAAFLGLSSSRPQRTRKRHDVRCAVRTTKVIHFKSIVAQRHQTNQDHAAHHNVPSSASSLTPADCTKYKHPTGSHTLPFVDLSLPCRPLSSLKRFFHLSLQQLARLL
jgi:hypothetical protein